jgi:MFS family permease
MTPLALLFVALFNSILGLSLLFPILGPLGRELGLTELQVGTLTAGYALAQFVGSPYWGRKSEVWGRKPVLLLGIVGFSLTFFAFGAVAHCGLTGVLEGNGLFVTLLATRLVGGLFSAATLPTAQAYIADVTSRDERTSGMALIGAAFGLAVVVGPALGALLAAFGLLVPVYVSSAVAAVNALFVWSSLPEPERRIRNEVPTGLWSIAEKVWVLLAVGFVTTLASVAMEQTIAFYFQDRLALTPQGAARAVGFSLVVYGVVAVLVQGFFVRRVRWSPLRLLRTGVPIAALGLSLLAAAEWRVMLVAAMALQGMGQALALPGVTAALSLSVRDDEQGAVAGLNSSSQALARTVGPLIGTGLYEIDPGYPYVGGAGLLILVLLFLLLSRSPALRVQT